MDDVDLAATASMWDVMSEDEKLAALDEIINDTLTEFGYEEVDVVADDLDGGAYGETSDGEIALDADSTLFEEPFSEALDTAYHEAAHVMDDQDDMYALMTDEQLEDFNAWDLSDDPHGTADPLHQNVEDFAHAMVDEARERIAPLLGGGGSGPTGAAGAAASDAGDSGFDFTNDPDLSSAAGGASGSDDSASDFDFEIDMAGVEVSP